MNNTIIKLAILQLILLASQAIFVYISSTARFKATRSQYLLGIPFAVGFPVALFCQDPGAYSIYEYAVVICMITAGISDAAYAAFTNKEYLTAASGRRFLYAFLLICIACSINQSVSVLLLGIASLSLAASFILMSIIKGHPAAELLKAFPLALFSFGCSYALCSLGTV